MGERTRWRVGAGAGARMRERACARVWVRVRAKRERVKLAVTKMHCNQPPSGEGGGFAPALAGFWAKSWLWSGCFRMRGYKLPEVRAWRGAYIQHAKARGKTSKNQPRVLHTVQALVVAHTNGERLICIDLSRPQRMFFKINLHTLTVCG
jgi:hypothetical protein